jgi:hypothetical protein
MQVIIVSLIAVVFLMRYKNMLLKKVTHGNDDLNWDDMLMYAANYLIPTTTIALHLIEPLLYRS